MLFNHVKKWSLQTAGAPAPEGYGFSIKSAPLVSVVIPTHNRNLLLIDAVESALAQTWSNIEVVIVDDGSTDDTAVTARRMIGTRWPQERVRYTWQQNMGASAARNHGLRLSHGAYVQFLDSDDLLYPTKVAKQVGVLEQSENRNAVCCNCYGEMGPMAKAGIGLAAERIGYPATNPKELVTELSSRRVHGMQTSAPLWRRRFLAGHAGWREDIALGDDLEYHIRLLADADKVCFIDEELFFVREHPGSRLSADQMSAASLASLIRTRQAIFSTLQQCGLWDAQTQRAFLGAMRTIYANALQLGNHETIRALEEWLWELANSPERNRQFHTLILLRRVLGRRFLLGAHKLANALRST